MEQNNMQSITVQYLPATNHRPTRLKAKCAGGSITIPLDGRRLSTGSTYYSINNSDYIVERTVALALIAKMNWGQHLRITGAGRDYRGDVVFTLGRIETDKTSKRDRTPLALIENDPRRLADLETDSTSKRDRWIEQVQQTEIPTEYHDVLTYWYDKTQEYADATPIEYMRRMYGGSNDDATAIRKMLGAEVDWVARLSGGDKS